MNQRKNDDSDGTGKFPAEDREQAPVFLIGCHRSGTTLTGRLLNAHPRIACPGETKFIAGLHAFVDYPQVMPALRSLGFSMQDVRVTLRGITRAILDSHTRSREKHRWVDKTPNYSRYIDFIDEIFEGKVLFLFIVRHPFDNILSLEEMFGRGIPIQYAPDPDVIRHLSIHGPGRLSWAKHWRDVNERILVARQSFRDRAMVLKYEDLASDPEASMDRALQFIGEKSSPGLIQRAFTDKSRRDYFYGDEKFRDTENVHRQSIGKWKMLAGEEMAALWAVVKDIAVPFGYQSPE